MGRGAKGVVVVVVVVEASEVFQFFLAKWDTRPYRAISSACKYKGIRGRDSEHL